MYLFLKPCNSIMYRRYRFLQTNSFHSGNNWEYSSTCNL